MRPTTLWTFALTLAVSVAVAAGLRLEWSITLPLATLLPATVLTAVGFAMIDFRRMRAHERNNREAVHAEHRDALRDLAERLQASERNATELDEQVRGYQRRLRATAAALDLVRAAAPTASRLAAVAIERSEHGATSMTEEIYELARKSTELSTSITRFLREMTEGDHSVEHSVAELDTQAERIAGILALSDETASTLEQAISSVGRSVAEMSQQLETVGDIAEQTSVLAINAAICAAKAGEHGTGFAVIAGEIQKLAGGTKRTSESTKANVSAVAKQVTALADGYRSLAAQSRQDLSDAVTGIKSMVRDLMSRAAGVGESIQQADRLSRSVGEHLDTINTHMQGHDAIQQIVDHAVRVVQDAVEHGPGLSEGASDPSKTIDVQGILRELTTRRLTMKDEYEALGYAGYEVAEKAHTVTKDGTKLEGDVTLF